MAKLRRICLQRGSPSVMRAASAPGSASAGLVNLVRCGPPKTVHELVPVMDDP